ncbi:hypothetical protein EDB81DRAFT_909475 [Dactylonectria macrodidyma]|uniref:Uncharacterized protein n=1 Tax=Dactylonectria macrodidyma TaxID=307937 RepID=A0A9P9FQZ9_9HYPO|nr:hypothetical protein EDB81DRAFT_909475 [Dactylonectria macrodidyma]
MAASVGFSFEPCTRSQPSKDRTYRQLFSRTLARRKPSLSYAGYKRALEIYGNEVALRRNKNFEVWGANNLEVLSRFRKRAREEGFNPSNGYSDRANSKYYFQQPGTKLGDELEFEAEFEAEYKLENEPENNPENEPLDTTSLLPWRLQNMLGIMVQHLNDIPGSCIGAAEIAQALAETLDDMLHAAPEDVNATWDQARAIMHAINGPIGVARFTETIRMIYLPPPQLARIQAIGADLQGESSTATQNNPS